MRTISDDQKGEIEDASTADLLRNLNPAILEKDIHVTEALVVIAQSGSLVQEALKKGPGRRSVVPIKTRVVFAGGTCLSKAYGVIERMSEDIDLKIELDPIPEGYALPKKLGLNRARLKALHNQVLGALKAAGFELVSQKVWGERKYCCMSMQYKQLFQDAGALRPQLKLEFVYQETPCPSRALPVNYLMARLLNPEVAPRATLDCVCIEQTTCEKVLSLLRRYSEKLEGTIDDLDPTIIRHIYDVRETSVKLQLDLEQMKKFFPTIVEVDRAAFGNRHSSFGSNPKATLARALEQAQQDENLREQYESRLRPLVFSLDHHDFDTSFAKFAEVARPLIDGLPEVPELTEPVSAPPDPLRD